MIRSFYPPLPPLLREEGAFEGSITAGVFRVSFSKRQEE
jgi:hypothetical protein